MNIKHVVRCVKDIVITALQIKQNDNNNNTIVSNNQIDQKVIERYKKREFAFQSTTIKLVERRKKEDNVKENYCEE